MRFQSKIGLFFSGIYLLLVAISGAYIIYRIHWKPAGSEFCGLPLTLLSQPWSLWTGQILRALHFNFDGSVYLNIVLLLPGAGLNAWLIYRLIAFLEKKKDKKRSN